MQKMLQLCQRAEDVETLIKFKQQIGQGRLEEKGQYTDIK